jgi:two-component system, cell cycle sensor histidine kinase and response regulator CckA
MQTDQTSEATLQGAVERQRIVMEMAHRIRQSLKLTDILQTTVDEVRQFLQTDRVMIFQFSSDMIGTIVVESVGAKWPSRLAVQMHDECLAASYVETFLKGHITSKSDIYTDNIDPCHRDMLATFQVRANLVVPILQDEHLWGLLIAHHCEAPRQWQTLEMDLLRQLAMQLGIAIQQSRLFEQVQAELHDRVQAEAALKIQTESLGASEARYRLLFESTPNPMWVFDQASLAFLEVNQAAIAHYGYSKAEFLQMTIGDMLPPQDLPALYQTALTVIPGQIYTGIWQHCKRDGGVIDVEITAHVIVLGDKPASLVLVTDITARRQAEQQIREQAALIDIATDAIVICDFDHRILFWNQGAERLYGWQSAEVMGQDAVELLHPDDLDFTAPAFPALLDQGTWQGEIQEQTKTKQTVIVESRWTLMRDEVGEAKSILVVSTDMTQRKQLESQFLRVQRLESVGMLASGIAHDLNNVFTPILASAELLPMKFPDTDDRTRELLQMLGDSARHGADLVKQILSFGRGSEGRKISLQPGHLLVEVARVAKQTFPKTIDIRSDVTTVALWTVVADATQLHQILMNLCVNARDAMPTGGTLKINAANCVIDSTYAQMNIEAHLGPHVVMTIADTGIGIAPNVIDRIFDPFFTTKAIGEGTGLGLSTVIGIVKNHGGWVTVYSEMGQGTTFKVYLPASTVPDLSSSAMPESRRGQGELVLVVEDETLVQRSTKNALEEYNYTTLTANDGIEAIALYAQHTDAIDVVLMDLMMPTLDGLTAARTLKKLNPHVKIITTSGLITNRQKVEAAEISVQAFLSKPYTIQELLTALYQVLHPVD